MNELLFLLFINIIGAVLLSLVFFYLFQQYREKYMKIWFFSWLFFGIRITLDLLRFLGTENRLLLLSNQLFSITSVLFLLWGMNEFTNQKKMNSYWIYTAIIATLLSDLSFLFGFSIENAAIPTAIYFGSAEIWTGRRFLQLPDHVQGLGKVITGYSFILTGLLNILYPFIPATTFFSTTSFLWILILLGVLVVYFQKIRSELVESKEKYRLLADNAKDIVYRLRVSTECSFDYVSPSLQRILNYSPEEIYENPSLLYSILNHNDGHQSFMQILRSSELYTKPMEFVLLSKNNQKIWVENQMVPIFDPKGQLIAVEGIIRDISERKRVEQEMSRLNQLNILGETAATIAHEIRNPLTSVHGFLQLLKDRSELLEYKEWFDIMRGELERANSIITDYLTFTKRDQKDFAYVNLNEVILKLFPLIESKALLYGMQIQLALQEIPDLFFDEKEIRQLILNLAQNGLEAMQAGGSLYITTKMDRDHVCFAVRDEGGGMESQVLEKIGTPFFTTKINGTGLGLAVCYQIANRHRAFIEVDTNEKGTTFSIYFKE